MRFLPAFIFLVLGAWAPVRAVENGGTFPPANYIEPSDATVPNWDEGWNAAPGINGWNYVGLISSPEVFLSGVYLGNGYVLTSAHGGSDFTNFSLNGVNYTPNPTSYKTFSTYNNGTGGTADLLLFQLTSNPVTSATTTTLLPNLSLASSLPVGYNPFTQASGTGTVIVGFGDPMLAESWGTGTVFETSRAFTVSSTYPVSKTFNSLDYDIYLASSGAPGSTNNNSNLSPGDSGGADFVFNLATQTWQLAGINEFQGSNSQGAIVASGFVQVDDYLAQINADIAVPEPTTWALAVLGCAAMLFLRRRHSR